MRNSLISALVVCTSLLAIPATSSASVFCVGQTTNCASSQIPAFPQTAAGIHDAVQTAADHPGFDLLEIAAGNYSIDSDTFPALSASGDQLWINGAGAGETIFTGTADGVTPALNIELPNENSMLNGITLNVTFTSRFATGVTVKRGQINEFEINQTGTVDPGAPASAIEILGNTSLYRGSVSTAANVNGLSQGTGHSYVRWIKFTGAGDGSGAKIFGTADAELGSLRLVGYGVGARIQSGSLSLNDSLIDMKAVDGASGIVVNDQNAGITTSIELSAERDTIIGSGASTGIYLSTQEAGDASIGTYEDLLIYGTSPSFNSWLCFETAGSSVAFDYSGLASNVAPSFQAGCGVSTELPLRLNLTESPFVDFALRSLRPKWNSPIVDAGGTTATAWDNDLDDGSHRVDGNNDGDVISDIGAFEYQADPPSGAISAPGSATPGQVIAFTHSMTEPDPTNSITGVVWDFGDGSSSTFDAPTHAYSSPGEYTVSVSATNQAGSVGTATAVLRVAIPVVPTLPLPPGPPTAKVTTKPTKAVTIGKSGLTMVKKGKSSFAITYVGAAKSKFTLQSISKKKRLKTLKGNLTLPLPATASPVKFSFGGSWNKKKLSPGKYRLTITPLAASGSSGKPVTVELKLKK